MRGFSQRIRSKGKGDVNNRANRSYKVIRTAFKFEK